MLCLPRWRFLNLQVGWRVPGDLRVGCREGGWRKSLQSRMASYRPGFLTWNCVLPTMAHKLTHLALPSSHLHPLSILFAPLLMTHCEVSGISGEAASGFLKSAVGCTAVPSLLLLRRKLGLGSNWWAAHQPTNQPTNLQFYLLRQRNCLVCWCELVQRKRSIKVMSSGSIYAALAGQGKHTFS